MLTAGRFYDLISCGDNAPAFVIELETIAEGLAVRKVQRLLSHMLSPRLTRLSDVDRCADRDCVSRVGRCERRSEASTGRRTIGAARALWPSLSLASSPTHRSPNNKAAPNSLRDEHGRGFKVVDLVCAQSRTGNAIAHSLRDKSQNKTFVSLRYFFRIGMELSASRSTIANPLPLAYLRELSQLADAFGMVFAI